MPKQRNNGVHPFQIPGVGVLTIAVAFMTLLWPWYFLHGTARWAVGTAWTVFVVLPIPALFIYAHEKMANEFVHQRRLRDRLFKRRNKSSQ
jgi:hypothetical protein